MKKTRPNGFVYQILRILAIIYLKFRCKFRVKKEGLKNVKGSYLLIFNHYSNYDFLFAATAIGSRRVNFVVSSYFFRNKGFARILKANKCISKEQFKPDLKAIRQMKAVINEGGIIGIAPAGQVSITGESTFISPAIIKLIRFLKTDVVSMVIKGAHLLFPKWGVNKRRGRIDAEYVHIIKKEELDNLTDQEIYDRVVESISINDYTYQAEKKYPIKGKNMIEGLNNILYYCPKCHQEFYHQVRENVMECTYCGNKTKMDKYGFLAPVDADSVCFSDEVKWYRQQKERLAKEMQDPNFVMTMEVDVQRANPETSIFEYAGHGMLTFKGDEITYEGELLNELVTRQYSLKSVAQLPFKPAAHIEIPNDEAQYLFQPVNNKSQLIKWVIATDILNDLNLNKE